MVKIVVPSHSSRYIVTASDLAKYLRSLFGEGYDFQIEVLPKCQPSPAFIHWLTTIDSIPMTFGILKARETSQMYVAFITSLFGKGVLFTDACHLQQQIM